MDYKEIIQLISGKDKQGVEQLYERYGKKLYAFAVYNWQFSEDEAWEMIYKTLDTLLLKLPTYDIESELHFNNLVFKIFKNNLKQSIRDSRRKESKLSFVNVEDFTALQGQTDTIEFSMDDYALHDYYKNDVLETTLFTHLKAALEQLDPQEKELLLLRVQNYSYEEIADFMKIENNQLKVKYLRAKKKLVSLMSKQQKTTL